MQNYKIPLEDGEEVKLHSPGGLSREAVGRWRLGEWLCTGRRILFLQGDSVKFSMTFDSLLEIVPCEREYSFHKKRCLKAVFNDGSDNKTFWIITSDIAAWEESLSGSLKGSLTEDDISQIAHHLGHDAERILWHLYRRRHATISELSDIVGAKNHIEVLNTIRKEINNTVGEVAGQPVLVFKPEGIDQNGRKVAYSWWFAGGKIAGDGPFCDIIDEDKFYRVIVESPPDAEAKLEDNRLHLKDRRGFAYSLPLPSNASHSIHTRSYRNGVLELCILKRP